MPRFLRQRRRYYESVRLPVSAQRVISVVPHDASPSATTLTAPTGSPGSRDWPFVRDAAHDPGGASPPRFTAVHMLPSAAGTASASTTFTLSGLPTRTLHDPCLRF